MIWHTLAVIGVVAAFFGGLYLVFRKFVPDIIWRFSIWNDLDKWR